MADSKRNVARGRATPKVERDALETLSLGHACLRSECGSGSGTSRLRAPARRRSPLHRSRPSESAETHFVSNDYDA
jgi:hypothetical protein